MTVYKKVVYQVNNQEIHAREEGPPNARIALMIHGWGSSWFAVSPVFNQMKQRYRCIAIDLPGYGDSPRLTSRTTIPAYIDLVISFLKEISKQPVILVGHSMGGMISLGVSLKAPEMVERMVLLCPTISGRLSLFINMFMTPFVILERFPAGGLIVSLLEPSMLSLTDSILRPALFADRTGITREEYEKIRADARRPGQGSVRAECFWAMRQHDIRDRLKNVKTPSLVIWGMEDNTVPLRDASVVAREWADADLRVIPNAGHWPQFETPDITERHIRAFLSTPLKLLTVQF